MKNVYKISSIVLVFLLIFCSFCNVYANGSKNALEIVQKASETKYLENDQGFLSKTIVDSNKDTGEVTVELKLSNVKKDSAQETQKYEDTEIYIMISENIVNDDEKLVKMSKNIETLTSKILKANSKTKIGIVGITGTISDVIHNENGTVSFGPNDEGTVQGSASNAEIVVGLTNKVEDIMAGIEKMNTSKTSYRLNLQAAIKLANKNYSTNTNKILISLYDGVPKIAIGVESQVSYGRMVFRV